MQQMITYNNSEHMPTKITLGEYFRTAKASGIDSINAAFTIWSNLHCIGNGVDFEQLKALAAEIYEKG